MAGNVKIDKAKIRESTIIRGIAATINTMGYPTLKNLKDLIRINFGDKFEER